jgi:sec-independent protein translocase protein TatC
MSEHRQKQQEFLAMTLGDHLQELRLRLFLAIAGLLIASVICLFFGKAILSLLQKPYLDVMGKDANFLTLKPTDGFVLYVNTALIAGVIVASPWIFYQIWMFISAGLYNHEKRYVYFTIPFSAALFITGASFFIFVVAPAALKFLVTFNKDFLGISSNFTLRDYLSFIWVMVVIFGLMFQTPIVVFFLNKMGLVSVEKMRKSRKYILLGVFVLAAVIAPSPDLVSLFAIAIPMYLMFEIGLLTINFATRKKLQPNQP